MRARQALTSIAATCILLWGAAAARGQEPSDLPEPEPATDEEIYQGTCGHLGTPCAPAEADVELELLTRPVRVGKEVRVRFRATFADSGAPFPGARVKLAGEVASTDREGRAAVVTALVRPGRYTARLSGRNIRPADLTVPVVKHTR